MNLYSDFYISNTEYNLMLLTRQHHSQSKRSIYFDLYKFNDEYKLGHKIDLTKMGFKFISKGFLVNFIIENNEIYLIYPSGNITLKVKIKILYKIKLKDANKGKQKSISPKMVSFE